jgi:catechol 2,3-dioxygenase-like lactoylglutathione lyase family enzyme
MLRNQKIIAFLPARDLARAKQFYRDTLGLRFISEDAFALVFEAAGTMLRIARVEELNPANYTVLGWEVDDIARAAKELHTTGVKFERYPGMPQDDLGVWKSPSGARVAWFKDPDGNTLSLTQL